MRRLRVTSTAGAALCLLLAACTAASPAPVSPSPSGTGPVSTSVSTASNTTTPTTGAAASSPVRSPVPVAPSTSTRATAPGSLTLSFAGDVHFEGGLARLLDEDDGLSSLRPYLAGSDLAVVNLETSITDRGTPQPKIYHFRTTPQALLTLQDAGVDAVSMANNHAVDFGPLGLDDTLAAVAASPIPAVGIGRTAEQAFKPAVFTIGGTTVALLGSTQIDDFTAHAFPATDADAGIAVNLDNTRLLAAVRAARASYDVVVVFLHWGTDYRTCPDGSQRRTAAALADAGADVVVGGHAHRVQGSGWLGRSYVGYGLGNFVWLVKRGDADARSGILTVTVDADRARRERGATGQERAAVPSLVTAATWQPMVVGTDGVPRPPTPAQAPAGVAALEQAQACSGLADHS